MNIADEMIVTLSLTVKKLIGPAIVLVTVNIDKRPFHRMLLLMGYQIAGWKV